MRGGPGVGKMALLDFIAEQASGCLVARAAAGQSEMELAFAGLHQLLAPMLDHSIASRFPCRMHASHTPAIFHAVSTENGTPDLSDAGPARLGRIRRWRVMAGRAGVPSVWDRCPPIRRSSHGQQS
jgi:hypothetical protein